MKPTTINVRLVIFLITLKVLLLNLISVDAAMVRGQSISRFKSQKNKEIIDASSDEIQFQDIAVDETFECYKCAGKYCHRSFINYKIRVESVVCEPGEICWVGESKNYTMRGCGTRECLASERMLNNYTKRFKPEDFPDNHCCIDNMCNSVERLRFKITVVLWEVVLIFYLF